MSVIAKVYWRCVKRGSRAFAAVPAALQAEVLVLALAAAEAESGALSRERYAALIGAEPSAGAGEEPAEV